MVKCCRFAIRPVRVPNVPFDRKHDIRPLLSVLSVVFDDPPMTDVTGEQDICPCPCLWLYLYLTLSPFHRKGKLVRSAVR